MPTRDEIKTLRLEAKLTQAEAAELIETNVRTWQGWERKSKPKRMPNGSWVAFRDRVRLRLKKGRKGRKCI